MLPSFCHHFQLISVLLLGLYHPISYPIPKYIYIEPKLNLTILRQTLILSIFLGMDGEDGMRTWSFRYEDYNNRRAFLRSYPLHWGEDEDNQETVAVTKENITAKKPTKKIILAACHWSGEKVVVLRRFKHRLTAYIMACISIHYKSSTALISV